MRIFLITSTMGKSKQGGRASKKVSKGASGTKQDDAAPPAPLALAAVVVGAVLALGVSYIRHGLGTASRAAVLVGPGEFSGERRFDIACRGHRDAARGRVAGCSPERCGRMFRDNFLSESEVARLVAMAGKLERNTPTTTLH